jgi:hypothetical protein
MSVQHEYRRSDPQRWWVWLICWTLCTACMFSGKRDLVPHAVAQEASPTPSPSAAVATSAPAAESTPPPALLQPLAQTPLSQSAPAAAPVAPKDPLLFESGPTRVKFSLDGVLQQSGVTGSWWNLSEQFAPDANYKVDRAWAESWIKPGVRVDTSAADWVTVYSGVSYVGSSNLGKDVFEQGNRGLWAIEDAYLGARIPLPDEASTLDVSYGRQPYKIGTGMLIAVGALNGFERGATTTFARRAWEEAGIVRWSRGPLSLDGFYLNPNELRSGDTSTRLAGTKFEWNPAPNQSLGIAYINVFESIFPYTAAPLQLLPDGRQGLNTVHLFGRWNPLPETLPDWSVAGDYAHQWNDRINMAANAYNLETAYAFSQRPLTPRLAYAYRSFSGDDPGTSRFEKFDPLYYEGAPALWATGSNGSFSFLNSNVRAHRLSLNLTLNPTNFMAFYYWHVRADQVNSPLQFGQAGRIEASGGEPQLVAGVPNAHLSDDLYCEYTRMLTTHVFLTTGVAVSFPGRGYRDLVDNSKTWVGGLANLTMKY